MEKDVLLTVNDINPYREIFEVRSELDCDETII